MTFNQDIRTAVLFAAAAAGCVLAAESAKAQSGFTESSVHGAHLLYAEGSAPVAMNFARMSARPGAFLTASDFGVSSSAAPASVAEFVEAPAEGGAGDKGFLGGGVTRAVPAGAPAARPFNAVAVAVKVGSGGVGFDVATPVMRRVNLRSGATFFQYNNASFTQDGLNINGNVKLQTAGVNLDIYPFGNSFRISPGMTFKNNNYLNAALLVPGGQDFSLGDTDYTSSPTDPIHGTAAFQFGTSNLAPRLTVGFGNMLKPRGGRFSVPTEIGFEYVAQPIVKLTFAGSGCNNQGCGPVDPASVQQEQQELQSDLAPLRFYPIVSIGVSMRLGHLARTY
jgi:hypothetical protein